MELSTIYIFLFSISLMFLIAQVLVRDKQTAHIIFALFCGSIVIMATKHITSDSIGAYQYLIGMGSCLTCNAYWLLSRSLFRDKNAIMTPHIAVAGTIAVLIIVNQGYLFINNALELTPNRSSFFYYILHELTILLSSTIIMLSFWEGCRGYSKDTKKGKSQRLLFLATFGLAIGISKLSQGLFIETPKMIELITVFIILFVLINTQILLSWRYKNSFLIVSDSKAKNNTLIAQKKVKLNSECKVEQALATEVETLLIKQSLFLRTNLKVADIARELNVSEYKISKALRHTLQARNFNQYVNELRIKHAKMLLADPDKKTWPVLVIGLESGFASIGPFTRTFKLLTGSTPNQYRKNELT